MSEEAYMAEGRTVWQRLLSLAIQELGPEGDAERWRAERADIVAQLRSLCEEFGDNDWKDEDYLADVIERRLGRHLHKVKE